MIRRLLMRLPRGLVLGLVPGLLVIGASGAHPAYADATPPVVDIVNLNGGSTNWCLDQRVDGSVVLQQCDGGSRQDWKLTSVPNQSDATLIRNDNTGQCLDIKDHDPNSGAQVVARDCAFDGSDPFQLWDQESAISGGFAELANAGNGTDLVLHPSGCALGQNLAIFMNERSQCTSDWWAFVAPT